jgi:hypothetical protein
VIWKELCQTQDDGAADGGVHLHLDGVDRADERGAIDRRLLGNLGTAGESDDAHFDVPGNSCRNFLAASCAATMRVGLTSFTRMLRDTSIASMIVDLAHGSATGAVGRATASRSTHRPGRTEELPPPCAAGCTTNDAQVAHPQRRLARPAQQPQVQRRQQGQRQHQPQVLGPQEAHLRGARRPGACRSEH